MKRPGCHVHALFALTFLLLSISATASDQVWVRIHHASSDPAIAEFGLQSSLSDYGSMQWGRVSAQQAAELEAAGLRISVVDNPFKLTLGGQTFDPLDEASMDGRFQPYQADPRGDFHLIQFEGPVRSEWLSSVKDFDIELVQYIHPYSYVVWADSMSLAATRSHEAIRWVGDFLPEFRVVPDQRNWTEAEEPAIIAVSRHVNLRQLAAFIGENGGELIEVTPYTSSLNLIKALVPGPGFLDVSRAAGVYTVQRGMRMTTRGEMSNQSIVGNYGGAPNYTIVPGYADWLASTGLDGSGVIVSIMDSGVRATHIDLADRMLPCTPSASPTTCSSPSSAHGTHVAGAVAGTGATGTMLGGFLRGQGVAPGANMISQVPPNLNSWWGVACSDADPSQGEFCLTPDGMLRLFKEAATNGALLANNSWGSPGFQYGYDIISQQVDVLVRNSDPDGATPSPVLPLWSIQNGGGDRTTGSVCDPASLGSPEEAKNVFAVGATRLQNSGSGAQVSGAQIFSVGQNSAHGPACDGRTNPDIVAPGWSTDSTASGSNTAHGFMGGTSMASPVVSGASAIFIQYYRELFEGATPSPAMIKAALSGIAMNMHGQLNADGGVITETPSRFQGWGRLDLDAAVNPPNAVMYFDQETVFTATGQDWSIPIVADDNDEPIRLMLMWTDAPGHGLSGNTPAWVNLLDLSAETANGVFLGNQIGADGFSVLGGSPDDRNNMEGIFLRPDQHAGQSFEVTVTAAQIVADALDPWNPDVSNPRQDFALVCYNCQFGQDTFSLAISPPALDVCLPEDGSINENVSVSVGALADYSGTVDLSSAGEPSGVSSDINPVSVDAPGNATWTLNFTGAATAGSSTVELIGSDGLETKSVQLALQLDEFLSDGPVLNNPGNGSSDTSLTPSFSWAGISGVETYQIQVATDAGFASIVIDESVTGTAFTPATELDTGTEYFWRVQGNNLCGGGTWSDTWSFTTRLEPVAEFSADSLSVVVASGGTTSSTLTISNTGTGNLNFDIVTDSLESTNGTRGFVGDFAPENWTLVNAPTNTGGSVSTEDGPPIEVYVEGGDNGVAGVTDFQIEIPFDGTISFDWGFQSEDTGDWDSGGYAVNGIYTELADNASTVPYFNQSATVEVLAGDLFAFRARTVDGNFGPGTFGASNFDFAPAFCGEPTDAAWLSVSPASGSVAADDDLDITILIDASGMATGEYVAYLCITTNDPNAELVAIPVNLEVVAGDGPVANITPASLAFDIPADSSDSANINIGNPGGEALNWDLFDASNDPACFDPDVDTWLTTNPGSGSVPAGGNSQLAVSVDSTGLAGGIYESVLCLSTNDTTQPLVQVPVELLVSEPPPIAGVTPESLSFSLEPGAAGSDDLLISNLGGATLVWDIETAEGVSSSQFQRGGDIVTFTGIDFTPNPDFTGGAVQWFTGDTCDCDTAPFDFNPYNSPVQWFWPNNSAGDAGGVSLDGGTSYAVLQPGDAIGPGSNFLAGTAAAATANWRLSDGVEGYLGFRFVNPDTSQTNYGYAHITTTGTSGHPMTIHGWAFNQAGDPITVAPLNGAVGCDSPASIPWLSIDPASGSTDGGETSEVLVQIDTNGLTPGQYQALLCITTNDADNDLIEVPVSLQVVIDELFADRFEDDQGRSSEK